MRCQNFRFLQVLEGADNRSRDTGIDGYTLTPSPNPLHHQAVGKHRTFGQHICHTRDEPKRQQQNGETGSKFQGVENGGVQFFVGRELFHFAIPSEWGMLWSVQGDNRGLCSSKAMPTISASSAVILTR